LPLLCVNGDAARRSLHRLRLRQLALLPLSDQLSTNIPFIAHQLRVASSPFSRRSRPSSCYLVVFRAEQSVVLWYGRRGLHLCLMMAVIDLHQQTDRVPTVQGMTSLQSPVAEGVRPRGHWNKTSDDKTDFERASEFLFAFRVLKVSYKYGIGKCAHSPATTAAYKRGNISQR
jgi:hypothetical protein